MAPYGVEYGRRYDWQPRAGRSYWSQSGERLDPGYGYDYDHRIRSRYPERASWGFAPADTRSGYGGEYVREHSWGHKSRLQTDYGDPYADRGRGTHIRVLRGDRGDFDRGDFDRRRRGYPADYQSRWRRGYDSGYPSRAGERFRGYDAYWY